MMQLNLLDSPPAEVDPDPRWVRPDTTGTRAGYCLECDKGVWLWQIQAIHPDATITNIRYMEYNKCPTCQASLIPF
jgi:hypothetical protein